MDKIMNEAGGVGIFLDEDADGRYVGYRIARTDGRNGLFGREIVTGPDGVVRLVVTFDPRKVWRTR
jgi:hypothetical protein